MIRLNLEIVKKNYREFTPLPYPNKKKEQKYLEKDLLRTINENLQMIEGNIYELKENTFKIQKRKNDSFCQTQFFEGFKENYENSSAKKNNRVKNLNINDLSMQNSNSGNNLGENLKIKSKYFYKIYKYHKNKQTKR